MRVGGGGSSSAAAAAAARERQREAARKAAEAAANAKKAAERARERAAATAKKAADAIKQAKAAKAEATTTKNELQRKSELLGQKGARMPREGRQKLASEIDSARTKLAQLEKDIPALERRANTLRQEALKAANETIAAEKTANAEAKLVGEKEPFPLANNIKDVFDAGSLSAKDQAKLLGRETVVTPQEAAKADAARVAAATRASVGNGAKALEQQLAGNKDPEYRQALIEAAKPSIEELGRQISLDDGRPGEEEMKSALTSLARAGEMAGVDGSKALAESFARHIPNHDLDIDDGNRLGGAMKHVLGAKGGATFAAELANSLQKAGKGEAAEEVSKLTREALQDARKDFEKAQKEVDSLNSELGRYVAGFGPGMTEAEQQKAVESFRERHKEDYEKWEAAGEKYASMIDGASAALENPSTGESRTIATRAGVTKEPSQGERLQEEAKKALELLPKVGETKAGLEKIAEAVAKKGQGEHTFLDSVTDVAKTIKGGKDYLDKVSTMVVKGTALKALELASTGKPEEMKKLMAGLEGHHQLLGVNREELKVVTELMGEFKPSMTDEQIKKLGRHMDQQIGRMSVSAGMDPNGPLAQSFKGLGVVVGGLSTFQGIKDWDKADASKKISTIGNAISLGTDGGALALDVFGKGSKFLEAANFLKAAGPAGAVVSALGDGLGAVNAFKEGKYAEGFSSGSMAIGAALMAVPSGVTQVIGGALIVGGAIGKVFVGKAEEHADENDLKAFLQAGGVAPGVADAINDLNGDRKNYGEVLTEAAHRLNSNQYDLLRHMATWTDTQVKQFQNVLEHFGDRDDPKKSGEVLAALIQRAGLAPPPPTTYNGPN